MVRKRSTQKSETDFHPQGLMTEEMTDAHD